MEQLLYMRGDLRMNGNLLSVEDICRELNIGRNTAYSLIKGKRIKAAKVGRRYLTNRAEIDRFIASTMLKASDAP